VPFQDSVAPVAAGVSPAKILKQLLGYPFVLDQQISLAVFKSLTSVQA
jgi:hypothetical protein